VAICHKARNAIRANTGCVEMLWTVFAFGQGVAISGHGVEANACQVRYERKRSCFDQWKAEKQLIAGFADYCGFGVYVEGILGFARG
jgi:hypothetical protein